MVEGASEEHEDRNCCRFFFSFLRIYFVSRYFLSRGVGGGGGGGEENAYGRLPEL